MAIAEDVLVVGGGLAGRIAALTAADQGASVRILSRSESTLRSASGLIDVLGSLPGRADPIVEPYEAIETLPDSHPYRKVGEPTVREAMNRADDWLPTYRGAHTTVNALIPTVAGTIKPTARYPTGMADGLVSDDRSTLLVGFERLPDFDPSIAAARLERQSVPFDVAATTLSAPGIEGNDPSKLRVATALDRSSDTRHALAERIKPALKEAERVGLPAVLGHTDHSAVRADLERKLEVSVFELPGGPPSIPGMRLQSMLDRQLREAGVRISEGIPAVAYDTDADRIAHVVGDHEGRSVQYQADQFVLATGGLVGRGLETDRTGATEPVFNCPVSVPEDRTEWYEDGPFGDHPFARFGVAIDGDCRPIGSDGTPRFRNLRAAGSVLEGYDFAAEKSGSGVSIATGYAAGHLAAAEVP
ncbi:MAG: glycerol-3-phosphate dehydrogenase subunit GlpB [Natrialbaceae archaeon]|nr:glycerol-3-phosphate dehydrogenase subunit GlpB [Natrialbaceae archaeon]